jgi:hypothetical protein
MSTSVFAAFFAAPETTTQVNLVRPPLVLITPLRSECRNRLSE